MMRRVVQRTVLHDGTPLSFETGRLGKLADGCVVARCGNTVVVASAVADNGWRAVQNGVDPEADANLAFVPLTVDYRQKWSSVSRIPRTFDRNDGPNNVFVLHSRSIDRCLRPKFPKHFFQPTQVIVSVYSSDGQVSAANPVAVGVSAASCALGISDIPFSGPVAASFATLSHSKNIPFKLFCAADLDGRIVSMEGHGGEISENALAEAAAQCSSDVIPILNLQSEFREAAGKSKREGAVAFIDDAILDCARSAGLEPLSAIFANDRVASSKLERGKAVSEAQNSIETEVQGAFPDAMPSHIRAAATGCVSEAIRSKLFSTGVRVDGRRENETRLVEAETGLLPDPISGSSLFSRGDTQVLCTVTMDGTQSQRRIDKEFERGVHDDELDGAFVLNYEFPPYSVNEVGRLMRFNRRQSGHSALAEGALRAAVSGAIDRINESNAKVAHFPYTIRSSAETTGSEGSSSMATVCGASLSLAEAGVPLRRHVAGISIGKMGDQLLTDILGLEDFFGDMDFKVAGTVEGVTAVQLDVKSGGLAADSLTSALDRAKTSREGILETMESAQTSFSKDRKLKVEKKMALVKLQSNESPGLFIGRGREGVVKAEQATGCEFSIADISDAEKGVLVTASDQDTLRRGIDYVAKVFKDEKEFQARKQARSRSSSPQRDRGGKRRHHSKRSDGKNRKPRTREQK